MELNEVALILDSTRLATNQPDLSILLALLSSSADEQTFLNRVELKLNAEPAAETTPHPLGVVHMPQPGNHADEQRGPVVVVTGFARSQSALSRFVMKLEDAAVFERVTILQNSSQPLFAGDAVGFKLECPMVRVR